MNIHAPDPQPYFKPWLDKEAPTLFRCAQFLVSELVKRDDLTPEQTEALNAVCESLEQCTAQAKQLSFWEKLKRINAMWRVL